jgi:hypothetical protein
MASKASASNVSCNGSALPTLAAFLLTNVHASHSRRANELMGTAPAQRERVVAPSPSHFVPPQENSDSQETEAEEHSLSPPEAGDHTHTTPPRIQIKWDELGSQGIRSHPKEQRRLFELCDWDSPEAMHPKEKEDRFELVGQPWTPHALYEPLTSDFLSECRLLAGDKEQNNTLQQEGRPSTVAPAPVQGQGDPVQAQRAGEEKEMQVGGQSPAQHTSLVKDAEAQAADRKFDTGDLTAKELPADSSGATEEVEPPAADHKFDTRDLAAEDQGADHIGAAETVGEPCAGTNKACPVNVAKMAASAEMIPPKRPASALGRSASKRARGSNDILSEPEGELHEPTKVEEPEDEAPLELIDRDVKLEVDDSRNAMDDSMAEDERNDTADIIWAGRKKPTRPYYKHMYEFKQATCEETVTELQSEFGASHAKDAKKLWGSDAAQRRFAKRLKDELLAVGQGAAWGKLFGQDIQRSEEFVRAVAIKWRNEEAEQFRQKLQQQFDHALELIGLAHA